MTTACVLNAKKKVLGPHRFKGKKDKAVTGNGKYHRKGLDCIRPNTDSAILHLSHQTIIDLPIFFTLLEVKFRG